MDWSSRTQARAALGREFPLSTLSMVARVPRPSLVHVACVLSQMPSMEFSPGRLQAVASCDQPSPARSPRALKPQVGMPPWDHRCEKVFVLVLPSCLCGGYAQRHQPRALGTPTATHGSYAPGGFGCSPILAPSTRSARLDDSHRFPRCAGSLRVCARRPGLGCLRDLPCFGSTLLPSVPAPLRRAEEQRHPRDVPAPRGFPPHNSASAPLTTPH